MKILNLKKLKCGAHIIAVREVDAWEIPDMGIAYLNLTKNEIIVDRTLAPTHRLAAILHEVGHVYNGELDEITNEPMSQLWAQFFVDNDLLK
jgi:hypothetical protein